MHRKVSFQNIIKNQIIAYIIELKQLLFRLEIEFIIKILFKLLNKDIINLSNLDFLVLLYYILYKFFIMKSRQIILITMCISVGYYSIKNMIKINNVLFIVYYYFNKVY